MRAVYLGSSGAVEFACGPLANFQVDEQGIIQKNIKNSDDTQQAIDLYYDTYGRRHDELVKSDEQISKLLSLLADHGKRIAVVTGKGRRSYELSVERLKMKAYIDDAITGDEVARAKPDGEGILKVLDCLFCMVSYITFSE